MNHQTNPDFGKLTTKGTLKSYVNSNDLHLDYLFDNFRGGLEKLSVVQAERQIALENLRNLTKELQTKRLRYKAKSSCKYFSL